MTAASVRTSVLALAVVAVAAVAAALLSGFFVRLDTLGAHDWDQMESHRYFVVKSIRDYGQFPFWDPYACGGFSAWGGPESATVVVSPFLPIYLALPLAVALRAEVVLLVLAAVAGGWFFARRYVEHPLSLAFVCVVGVLNSRLALQAAVGHTWHLYYAGMPWVLGSFDRANAPAPPTRPDRRWAWVACGAGTLAFMIYGGGIYPVPHTALVLLTFGLYRSIARDPRHGRHRWRPLLVSIALIVWAFLLAAPKLLAIRETMALFPRHTRSFETIDPAWWFRMFLSSVDSIPPGRPPGLDYMWHEYGHYIGPVPLAIVISGALARLPVASRADVDLRSCRFAGWACMALAFGGRWTPWGALHLLAPFRSQHVPSRFTYVGIFLLAVVAAHAIERRAPRLRAWLGGARAPLFDAATIVIFVAAVAMIGREDSRCTKRWFALSIPFVEEKKGPFTQYADVPPALSYGDGDPESVQGVNLVPALLLHRANVGAIRCSVFHGFGPDGPKGPDGRPMHQGARGEGDPLYRGEAWTDGNGSIELSRWSPSEIDLRVEGATPGDLVMLNQNWAPGWRANELPALRVDDVNAYRLRASTEEVTFRYRPRSLTLSFWLCALGFVGPCAGFLVSSAGYCHTLSGARSRKRPDPSI